MRVSIRLQLTVFGTFTKVVIVALLTAYLTSNAIDSLRAESLARAQGYGALLANQLQSAVAFGDRETAREVLSFADADKAIVGMRLYLESGALLYEQGTPSAWTAQASEGVIDRRTVMRPDRVGVVVPVVTLEGPRGTLVVEISRMGEAEQRRHAIITAAIVGGLASLFAFIVTFFLAGTLSKRVTAINDVASALTADPSLPVTVPEGREDEIGSLARSFNTMLAAVRSARHELETRVDERTAELRDTNEALQLEMAARTKMEFELRQTSKLESVGRLAAGIAHELNTPIQFVSDSVAFIEESSAQLVEVIGIHQRALTEAADGTLGLDLARARAQAAEDKVELSFLTTEMPLAVARSLQGMQRIAGIVDAMRAFAHKDQANKIDADLNQAITTTLAVARNEYKYVADIHTDLGALPRVPVFLGEINQVLLAVIMNAAHAIGEVVQGTDRRGTITIRTRTTTQYAIIDVIDDGCGMPPAIIDRIFEPFFTTKPPGQGAGQGLSIARSVIVEKHGGSISVESTPGRGSTFHLALPLEVTDSEVSYARAS